MTKNTKLKAFLPFFYLVWSDDLLSQKELATFRGFIEEQDWLVDEEKKQLLQHINLSAPPSRTQIREWKSEIENGLREDDQLKSLFDIVLALSKHDTLIERHKAAFELLENDLGLLGEEVPGKFKDQANSHTSKLQTSSHFDPQKLSSVLEGDQGKIINKVKTILSRPEFAYHTLPDLKSYRAKVYQWCRILADENLGNMAYPKAQGGGGDMASYFAIMETLSYHDLSMVIKFGVQFGLWGMSVQSLGTEKHHKKYLKDIGTLALPGCFAMTETNHGSNVKGLETTATYQAKDQTFVIHTPHEKAQKEYIGNAAVHGMMATVFARLIIDDKDYGINAFVVPLRNKQGKVLKGIKIGDCGRKMGLNGVDNGTIRFNKVVIPKENMLDRFASVNEKGEFDSPIPSDNRRFFTMLGTLVGGRIGIPRSALSASKSGLTIAIVYGDQRRQFGPEGGSEVPVLNYRMHQRRLMPLLAKTYALHFALQYLTSRFIGRQEEEMQEIEALAAGLKSYTTWHSRDTLQECREACGGKGYLSENRLDALKNDTEIYTTFEGDNTVLMQLVAKSRLAEFRKAFGQMNTLGLITYVYENAKAVISEKNPVITRKTDEAHLLDEQFHLHAFQHRERITLASAAKRIKKLVDSGLDAYDAFNVAQHQMIDVAEAYIDRVVLEQFQQAIRSVKDPGTEKVLIKLCELFALYQIEKNKGWYLEDGYMEAVKTKAIRKMVNQLCWEIREDAVPLTEAFGIPENCLGAAILK